MEKHLDGKLIEYGESDVYPFHMPGHKRRRMGDFAPEDIDITEIDGFDDLHHAGGILLEGQRRLASVFGADESFYLVNGSTAGILAAICGCIAKGDRILIGRNCHKSVYHAAYLMGAKVEYLYPEPTGFGIQGAIPPLQVEERLEKFPDIKVVVVTSPTYDGMVSDIETISGIAHAHGAILMVDEAHGAHFGFSDGFPKKAITLGADLCVESLHKTLPAYTQSAVLHMKRTAGMENGGRRLYRFNADRVRRYLDIFQSSSPSYVLMAGMDRCVRIVGEDVEKYDNPGTRRESLFYQFEGRLERFYGDCRGFKYVEVFPFSCVKDNSKILISGTGAGFSGVQLYDLLLEKYHLQMEMAAGHYVTALTSIMDTDEGFERLYAALAEIDAAAGEDRGKDAAAGEHHGKDALTPIELYAPRQKRMEVSEAMDAVAESVVWNEAVGRISAEFVYLYPPGIPILVPGELVTEDVPELVEKCGKNDMQVKGTRDAGAEMLGVVASDASLGYNKEP